MIETRVLEAIGSDIERAAELLRDGALVAFATETVYGLGADATNGAAVAGIFEAKGRPRFNPLIVHVPDVETAQKLTRWNDHAERLAQAFWPGPLTLVLPLADDHGLSSLVTAGLPSVAVRVPALQSARDLLRATGKPVAAPSANPSGRLSPTSAAHVLAGLNGRVAAVLDGGPCTVGLESTIVSLTDAPRLLRPGGIDEAALESALGQSLLEAEAGQITAPGQLASHYAPDGALRMNALTSEPDEVHLGFGDIPGDRSLSESGDLREAAANLFDALHDLNQTGRNIAVAPIPDNGLGQAINDRLRRAAAPRDS